MTVESILTILCLVLAISTIVFLVLWCYAGFKNSKLRVESSVYERANDILASKCKELAQNITITNQAYKDRLDQIVLAYDNESQKKAQRNDALIDQLLDMMEGRESDAFHSAVDKVTTLWTAAARSEEILNVDGYRYQVYQLRDEGDEDGDNRS